MAQNRAPTFEDDQRAERARPDSWLVGAFLLLFGVAVSAAMPQIAGAVRLAIANASKAGTAETAQRPSVRLHVLVVKAVQPKVPAGKDISDPPAIGFFVAPSNERLSSSPLDLAARIAQRGFTARAPPALNA
jgi:hypothetical protein